MFLQVSVILFTGGLPAPGGCLFQGGLVQGGACSRGSGLGGSGLGGACSGGFWSWGVPGGDPPGQLLLRAVRILLECILVFEIHFVIDAPGL